jgi:hypothetical protein
VVQAGNGDDVVIAGVGNDRVVAGNGDNLFKLGGIAGFASDGDDAFAGGNGADRFALFLADRDGGAAGWGRDTIEGFRLSQGDQLIAFDATAGFWDDPAQLLAAVQADLVTGSRSADGGNLFLGFGSGSSVTLRQFFVENAGQLSAAERGLAFGQDIGNAALAGLLQDVLQEGGSLGVGGPGYLGQAHDLLSAPFMF